ncbi:MAG: right-handed parallel beta-helix repeat-containing protein [Candidatus Zixiibacteriota bacterium]
MIRIMKKPIDARLICIILSGIVAAIVSSCGSEKVPIKQDMTPIVDTTVYYVPQMFPTIQEAVNAAGMGETVMVAPGVYEGEGNRGITFSRKRIIVIAAAGPLETVIDCEGNAVTPHQAFNISGAEESGVIDGFTIRGGYYNNGGAINIQSSGPVIRNCIFHDNRAPISGGAIRVKGRGEAHIINCTFANNSSMAGGAIFTIAGAKPRIENCLIAYSDSGGAIHVNDGTSVPVISCTDILGNAGGDWSGDIAGMVNTDGNFSAEPLFCDRSDRDFRLEGNSPCLPANNNCGVQIGATISSCRDD